MVQVWYGKMPQGTWPIMILGLEKRAVLKLETSEYYDVGGDVIAPDAKVEEQFPYHLWIGVNPNEPKMILRR